MPHPTLSYALGNFRDRGYLRSSDPLMYHLWWRKTGESWAELWWIALRLTAAAAMIAIAVWCLRDKLSPGWVAVLMIVIAVLVTLGPMRLAEATSTEVSSSAPNPAYQPSPGEKPWTWPWVAAYFDARAWGGYSIRALALVTLAMLAARSLVTRWRHWFWTEWAAFISVSIIAGFWLYDEFAARPALDGKVRVVLLATSLLVLAVVAWVSISVWAVIARRFRAKDTTRNRHSC